MFPARIILLLIIILVPARQVIAGKRIVPALAPKIVANKVVVLRILQVDMSGLKLLTGVMDLNPEPGV